MRHATYKGYSIDYDRKSIPTSAYDYNVVHEDYMGEPEDGSGIELSFNIGSVKAAKAYIDAMGVE